MERWIKFSFLLVFVSLYSHKMVAQSMIQYKYSRKILREYLLHNDNWEYFTSNSKGEVIFNYKSNVRACKILVIPVMNLNPQKKISINDTLKILNSYILDNNMYVGFLLKNKKPVWIIKTNAYNNENKYVGGDDENIEKLYIIYTDETKKLYFDNTFKRYAYKTNNSIYLWDSDKEKFIPLGSFIKNIGKQ